MGNGVMAIGPQLPRPSSTLPKRHCAGWLISCPESEEERTPIEGLRNTVRRPSLTRTRTWRSP